MVGKSKTWQSWEKPQNLGMKFPDIGLNENNCKCLTEQF